MAERTLQRTLQGLPSESAIPSHPPPAAVYAVICRKRIRQTFLDRKDRSSRKLGIIPGLYGITIRGFVSCQAFRHCMGVTF